MRCVLRATSDEPQAVMWRVGTHRCELWTIGRTARLRVFDGPTLVRDEPYVLGRGRLRAENLRYSLPMSATSDDGTIPLRKRWRSSTARL
jgi:hypothetical protein